MACERITAGIVSNLLGERPIKAMLDSYNPVGSTLLVRFTTSKKLRWETDGPGREERAAKIDLRPRTGRSRP